MKSKCKIFQECVVANKYHIRYNTKHGDSDLVWRVFENGTEYLVKDLHISVPVYTENTIENGVIKYNIACEGDMVILDNSATIYHKRDEIE